MEKPSIQKIKEKAKQFMTTAEIQDLGLDPFMQTAFNWRKLGFHVPDNLPDEAKLASFSYTNEAEGVGVLETIVIWNLDTFDNSLIDASKI